MSSLVQSVQQAATVVEEVALPIGKELLRRLISAMVPVGVDVGLDVGVGALDPTQGLSRSNFTVDPMGSNAHEAPFAHFKEEFQRPVVNISDLPEQLERKKKIEPRRESLCTPWETQPSVPLMKELGVAPTRQPLMKL